MRMRKEKGGGRGRGACGWGEGGGRRRRRRKEEEGPLSEREGLDASVPPELAAALHSHLDTRHDVPAQSIPGSRVTDWRIADDVRGVSGGERGRGRRERGGRKR
eukprot:438063-Rhodomonas_salina.2